MGSVQTVRVDLFQPVIKAVLEDDVGKEVVKTTVKVLNRARVLTPVHTGNLRASHQFKLTNGASKITGEVFTNVKYALAVHEGRRALVIRPNTKKALAFHWHGQQFVRKWVHQPARRGKPWLRDALREVATSEGYKMQSTTAADSGL